MVGVVAEVLAVEAITPAIVTSVRHAKILQQRLRSRTALYHCPCYKLCIHSLRFFDVHIIACSASTSADASPGKPTSLLAGSHPSTMRAFLAKSHSERMPRLLIPSDQ